MGFFGKKKNGVKGRPSSTYSTSPLTPKSAASQFSQKSGFSNFSQVSVLEEKDLRYKNRIRILRFVTRFISLILSALMSGIFIYTLAKYYLTRTHTVQSSSSSDHPWATPALLWPTFILLGISVTTFFMNLITLVSYCCSVGAANKTNSCSSILGYIFLAVHVIVWIVAAGAFKLTSNGSDLWGYSCGSEADKIQEEVKSFLDFGKLCTMNTGAWFASIIEAGFYLLTFIITIMMARRASTKKKMWKMRESILMEQGFGPGAGYGNMEAGTVYNPGAGKRYMPVAKDSPALS